MTDESLRKPRTAEERRAAGLNPNECYWCGATPKPPDELFVGSRNDMHNAFILLLRTPCCHGRVSTESYGSIVDYLCDGWARAQLICRLHNSHVGLKVDEKLPPRPIRHKRPARRPRLYAQTLGRKL